MEFIKYYNLLINEQNYNSQKVRTIINAMNNRNPITFYYSGPQKPPKDRVLNGVRIRAEVVAYGLSKKGNEIVRAYIGPPSTTLRGYNKTHWRTFRIDRMSSIRTLTDETFDKRNDGQYKEGSENSNGPMVTTYSTIKWDKTPEIKPIEKPIITTKKPIPTKKPTPIEKPEPLKVPEKPEDVSDVPLPKSKPSISPTTNYAEDIYKKLQTNIKDTDKGKTLSQQDFELFSKELYKLKEKEWIESQKSLNKNINPGEGTRKRFEIDSKNELSKLLQKNNVNVSTLPLNESFKRIKTLMFYR